MTHAVSLPIPCLGMAKHQDLKELESPAFFDTKMKVALVFGTFLTAVGLYLIKFSPLLSGACLAVSGLGLLAFFVGMLIKNSRTSELDSKLEKLEKFEAAKQLAEGIDIPPALQQELEQMIPSIDAIQEDDRVASVQYNCDETATFVLKSAPDLQFRVSEPQPESRRGCAEYRMAERYENAIYAHEICRNENYSSLLVPPMKPIFLKVDGARRSVLVEKVVQKDPLHAGDLEPAVRQMVQFLLKTGGNHLSDQIPFVPLEVDRLALQDLHHLNQDSHPDAGTRDFNEVEYIIRAKHSFLASLDREDLIDIALDELKKQRPIHLGIAKLHLSDPESATKARDKQIEKAKVARLAQIHAPKPMDPESIPVPNILGVAPEDLGLDLTLKDYAVIKSDGVSSDGTCRPITLKEVAQAVIDKINRKLHANPAVVDIEFTPEEMLIGETLPYSNWEKHYQYNMLQGLGYRGWPNPNKEPPYWMALVLDSLKNKGLIADFSVPWRSAPKVRIK